MLLNSGDHLGPYEILGPLGAGGMGEVYRARDTRLGRDVALKVLPQHLSTNPEARARFEREAKTISSLHHPTICTLFDIGREGATDYLVMELVEGVTLGTRIEKGPLPTSEVLRVGIQIADALERAHRAGVVHRDLKPGNVMLTKSGAKLMDFGLARTTGLAGPPGDGRTTVALSQSPTVAHPLTAEGSIIGTFQYMAPEQLEGKEADARSDLWAFGCVLYEMATGRPAFEGRSQASLISSIMSGEPAPIAAAAPLSPPAIESVVRRCLAKDPEDRWHSAHDVKLQLAGLAEGGPASGPMAAPMIRSPRRSSERVAWVIAGLALAMVAALLARLPGPASGPLRTVITAPSGTRLKVTGDDSGPPAISPDGTQLVFSAIGQGAGARLWLRRMDELSARPLPGTEGATFPFWSPDNRSIAFFASGSLKRLDVDGGSVRSLCPCGGARGGSWSRSGVILFTPDYRTGLSRVSAAGGMPVTVTTIDTTRESTHRWPQMLPDGRHFIYLAARHDDPTRRAAIWYGSLSGGPPHKLFDSPSSALYASGWLLYVRDSTLMAQRFDPASGRLSGEPVSTREVVQFDPSTWRTVVTISDAGLLVYGLGGRTTPYRVVWFDRTGHALRVLGEPANHISVALSPDGARAAVETQDTPNADVWVYDVGSGARDRVTSSPDDESQPVWSPDGARIAYSHQRPGGHYQMESIRGDGAGSPVVLHADSGADVSPQAWSPDGRYLYFSLGRRADGTLWRLSLDARHVVERVLPEAQRADNVAISPDGRWIAYVSLSSGRRELMAIPAPLTGRPPDLAARHWQLTSAGGDKPRWRRDGRELFYMRPDGMLMALTVNGSGGEFRVLAERPLFQSFQREALRSYDVAPDGQHFVICVAGSEGDAALACVSGWLPSLRRR